MAQSPREGQQAQKEEERPNEGGPQDSTATGTRGRHGEPVQRQAERMVEIGSERMRQATEASAAAAEEVMQHTSEASQALLRARTFAEMLEVQAKLLRDNMQSFVDQSARIAEAASRMATRPFNALKQASGDQTRASF